MKVKVYVYKEMDRYGVADLFPKRNPESHKGDYGKTLLLCGSVGYTGAAILSAKAACRTGSGLVYLCVPKSIYPIVAAQLSEPVVIPLEDNGSGHFLESNYEELKEILPKIDALLIGPGCGKSEDLRALIIRLILGFTGPVILDADGINVFESDSDALKGHKGPLVLTPHDGEFYRLYHGEVFGRYSEAVRLAKDLSAVLVRKGNRTIITDGHAVYRNTSGNPGMAKGGSGDVLAGMMVSMLGRNKDILKAVAGAVFLHGTAGDLSAEMFGQEGMLPSDMVSSIPTVLAGITE